MKRFEQYITKMTVLFDDHCDLCIRVMQRLQGYSKYIPLECVGLHSEEARSRFESLLKKYGTEQFIVVSNTGGVYIGTAARLMCLYATHEYRALSHRLSNPTLYKLADSIFEFVSANRPILSRLMSMSDRELTAEALRRTNDGEANRSDCKEVCA